MYMTRIDSAARISCKMALSFASWADVLAHVDAGATHLMYHAPLDRTPAVVYVVKRFRNGKLRLTRADVTFTADEGHLNRMGRCP